MLEVMRRHASSFLIQVLFAIIVIVFVFWGVNTGGDRAQPVAKVNGERILDGEFANAYQSRIRFAQQFNRDLSDAEIERIKGEVLDDLIVRELILQTAEDQGLLVSDHELALHIMGMSQFQDEEGRFDKALYDRELHRYRQSKTQFEENQREDLLIQRVESLVRRSVNVSDAEVLEQFNKDNHQLNLEFVRVSSALFRSEVDTDADRVAAYLADHEDDCRAYYEENYDRLYFKPKRVQASQIFMAFDDADSEELRGEIRRRMADVLAEARAGVVPFEDLAAKYSEHSSARFGGDLGFFDENRGGSPYGEEAFKAAAFSMESGEVSEVIETSLGLHILRIETVEDETTQSFDDVKLEIAERKMVDEEAPELARQYAEEIAATFSKGETPLELMDRMNVRVQETGLFALGAPSIPRIGDSPEIRSAAVANEVLGSGPPTAFEVYDSWIVFRVIDEKLPDPGELENQREEIASALLRRKRYDRVDAWRDSLKADADIEVFDIAM